MRQQLYNSTYNFISLTKQEK